MNSESNPLSPATGALLVVEGAVLVLLGLLCHPRVLSNLVGVEWTPLQSMQVRYVQAGFICIGGMTLLWGMYEAIARKAGPLILVSVVCLIPILAPFGILGYGSAPEAWIHACAAQHGVRAASASPLFAVLTGWLVPHFGWTGLNCANLLAGIATALVWFLLPVDRSSASIPLVSISVLFHPVAVLAMGTGVEVVWQTLFLSLATVFLLRGATREEGVGFGQLALSAACLGAAAGFHTSSLALAPVFLAVLFLGIPSVKNALLGIGLHLFLTLAVSLLCAAPGFAEPTLNFAVLRSVAVEPEFAAFDIFRFLLPIPALVLLAAGLLAFPFRFRRLEGSVRLAVGLSIGAILVSIPGFLFAHRGPVAFAVLVPFLAIVWSFGAPRMLAAVFIPLLALAGFVSVDWISRGLEGGAGTRFSAGAGPIVDEVGLRFTGLRRYQQLLLIEPKEETEVFVGADLPALATLRPDWELKAGVLANPKLPVRFHGLVPREEFDRLTVEGSRVVVVPGVEGRTRSRFGYDPIELGAVVWDPKKIYHR